MRFISFLLNVIKSEVQYDRFIVGMDGKYLKVDRHDGYNLVLTEEAKSATEFSPDPLGNKYVIKDIESSKVIDFPNNENRAMYVSGRHGKPNQQVDLIRSPTGNYKFKIQTKCLEGRGKYLYRSGNCQDQPAQLFTLFPVEIKGAEESLADKLMLKGSEGIILRNTGKNVSQTEDGLGMRLNDNDSEAIVFYPQKSSEMTIRIKTNGNSFITALENDMMELKSDENSKSQEFFVSLTGENTGKIISMIDGKCLTESETGLLVRTICDGRNQEIFEFSVKKSSKSITAYLKPSSLTKYLSISPEGNKVILGDIENGGRRVKFEFDKLEDKKLQSIKVSGENLYLSIQDGVLVVSEEQNKIFNVSMSKNEELITIGVEGDQYCLQYNIHTKLFIVEPCTDISVQGFHLSHNLADEIAEKLTNNHRQHLHERRHVSVRHHVPEGHNVHGHNIHGNHIHGNHNGFGQGNGSFDLDPRYKQLQGVLSY